MHACVSVCACVCVYMRMYVMCSHVLGWGREGRVVIIVGAATALEYNITTS